MKQKTGLICISILSTLCIGCVTDFDEHENNILEQKIVKVFEEAKNSKKKEAFLFRMDTLTNFHWDKMYAFAHLDSKRDVDQKLGFDWNCYNFPYLNDKDNLFIFVKDNKVVSYVFFEANNYDKKDLFFMSKLQYEKYFTPQNAVFKINTFYYEDKFDRFGIEYSGQHSVQ